MLLIFGSSGKNESFSRRTSSSSNSGSGSTRRLDLSINKAVLYLFLASALTFFTMVWIATPHAAEAQPRADRD